VGDRQSGAPHVLGVRHHLKVAWVNARPIAAQVVELVSIWHRADEKLVGGNVRLCPVGS
jgi:hypothetical protein